MRYLIAVDDTDDLTKETSTGSIAMIMMKTLKKKYGMTSNLGLTRHQLFLGEGVPYTSHNSAMCIDMSGDVEMQQIIDECIDIVYKNMAKTACPGICVLCADRLENPEKLMHFGVMAQNELLTRDQAHEIIDAYDCMFGKELGGTGQGIIGSVAGIGLRLTGNDGTFRGKINFPEGVECMTASELVRSFGVDSVVDMQALKELDADEKVYCEGFSKIFFRNHGKLIYVSKKEDGRFRTYSRESALAMGSYCEHFEHDNDSNECLSDERRCENCLYRRVTADGFRCDLNR